MFNMLWKKYFLELKKLVCVLLIFMSNKRSNLVIGHINTKLIVPFITIINCLLTYYLLTIQFSCRLVSYWQRRMVMSSE